MYLPEKALWIKLCNVVKARYAVLYEREHYDQGRKRA